MQQWIADALATVPDIARFAGVDALESELVAIGPSFRTVTTRLRVGTSRLGDAIHALRVGRRSTRTHALVFALPHPNEPVGGLTAVHLARRLCAEPDLLQRLGLTFTIVAASIRTACGSTRTGSRGPFTRTHYARNFYRPAGDQQIEWTFPIDYRPTTSTRCCRRPPAWSG